MKKELNTNYEMLYKAVGYDLSQGLRKSEDITEEEAQESSELYFKFMEKQQPGSRDIYMMAHMTQWFLSKGFDLFGLLEAIKKTM